MRELVQEIETLNISQEPGENIAELATKIYRICNRISGMIRATEIPQDLPEICASCFLETKTLAFNVESVRIHKEARDGKLTWDQVLTMVTNEYLALAKAQNTKWVALWDKKEDPEIKAMKAEIKSLKTELQRKPTSTPSPVTNANANADLTERHKNLTCRKCKNKGHIAKNCPTKGTATKPEGASNADGKKTGPTSPFKIPPKDNEVHTKTIDGVECAYCERCKRWTKGDKKHLTAQHKTKAELTETVKPQANLAAELDTGLFQLTSVFM